MVSEKQAEQQERAAEEAGKERSREVARALGGSVGGQIGFTSGKGTAAPGRKQVFRNGVKISDTDRVKVVVGGVTKFVLPETATRIAAEQAAQAKTEAQSVKAQNLELKAQRVAADVERRRIEQVAARQKPIEKQLEVFPIAKARPEEPRRELEPEVIQDFSPLVTESKDFVNFQSNIELITGQITPISFLPEKIPPSTVEEVILTPSQILSARARESLKEAIQAKGTLEQIIKSPLALKAGVLSIQAGIVGTGEEAIKDPIGFIVGAGLVIGGIALAPIVTGGLITAEVAGAGVLGFAGVSRFKQKGILGIGEVVGEAGAFGAIGFGAVRGFKGIKEISGRRARRAFLEEGTFEKAPFKPSEEVFIGDQQVLDADIGLKITETVKVRRGGLAIDETLIERPLQRLEPTKERIEDVTPKKVASLKALEGTELFPKIPEFQEQIFPKDVDFAGLRRERIISDLTTTANKRTAQFILQDRGLTDVQIETFLKQEAQARTQAVQELKKLGVPKAAILERDPLLKAISLPEQTRLPSDFGLFDPLTIDQRIGIRISGVEILKGRIQTIDQITFKEKPRIIRKPPTGIKIIEPFPKPFIGRQRLETPKERFFAGDVRTEGRSLFQEKLFKEPLLAEQIIIGKARQIEIPQLIGSPIASIKPGPRLSFIPTFKIQEQELTAVQKRVLELELALKKEAVTVQKAIQEPILVQEAVQEVVQEPVLIQEPILVQEPVQEPILVQEPITIQEPVLIQEPVTIQEPKIRERIFRVSRSREKLLRIEEKLPKTKLTFRQQIERLPTIEKLFVGIVGRPGTEFRFRTKALSLQEAVRRGKSFVAGTPAASIRFLTEEGDPLSFEERRRVFGFLGRGFKPGKARPGTFVEQPLFRINTPGEILGIPRRGQAARRRSLL